MYGSCVAQSIGTTLPESRVKAAQLKSDCLSKPDITPKLYFASVRSVNCHESSLTLNKPIQAVLEGKC